MSRHASDQQAQAMADRGYLQAAEAARLIGVAPSTVTRWVQTGKVESTTVGDTLYVKRASLAAHLGPEGAKALGVR